MMIKNTISAYIHIPFCKSKCNYCDFYSLTDQELLFEPYKNALITEIKSCAELESAQIATIFFGGGTPSLLPAEYLTEILEAFNNLQKNSEITVECNPETICSGYFDKLKSAGVNRISFGLQSANDKMLKKLGRIHDVKTFESAYNSALQVGFNNINIDIMFSLPGQTLDDWEKTLNYVISVNPTHISAYGLKIEESTPFFNDSSLNLPDDELDREMYYKANRMLKSVGYDRYEISNFAKSTFECEHNKVYWTHKDYISFGAAAHSFVNSQRFNNIADISKYIKSNGNPRTLRQNFTDISKKDAMSEFMFLGLRMTDGVCKQKFFKQFNVDMFDIYNVQIKKLEKFGLLRQSNDRIFLTDRGIDLSNYAFCEFV